MPIFLNKKKEQDLNALLLSQKKKESKAFTSLSYVAFL